MCSAEHYLFALLITVVDYAMMANVPLLSPIVAARILVDFVYNSYELGSFSTQQTSHCYLPLLQLGSWWILYITHMN